MNVFIRNYNILKNSLMVSLRRKAQRERLRMRKYFKINQNKLSSHASNIIEFIKIFSKFNEIKDDIISGDQEHKIYKSLSDYMEIVKDYYNKNDLFKIYDHEETDEILEDIENFILKKIHKTVLEIT